MKACDYCGRENADDARHCLECGTPFGNQAEPEQSEPEPRVFSDALEFLARPISDPVKWCLYFVAWGIVVLAMGRENVPGALLFPLGLIAVFPRGEDISM